ncbi:hypothetical protein PHYPSEUDO_002912 [Phytophthora pseudosyringae]|uniref:Uncharacterized protein n=1 Tax=Phytophthora pseudosyringae TaxID=221518 RepID=A0A8T1VV90_9STRA|nr:hypothetical protein PHYPSEUDO_002912 [Phytophthora pseudosyringae]
MENNLATKSWAVHWQGALQLQSSHEVGHRLGRRSQDALDPNATAVKVWEQVLLLCLLHESCVLLAFQPEAMEKVSVLVLLFVACEGVFAVDFYGQAHTDYYSDGNPIRDTIRAIASS